MLANAQSFRDEVQKGINQYFVPAVILIILIGAAAGLGKNWKNINDPHDEGKRKEGVKQAAMIAFYVYLFVAVLGIAVGLATSIRINIGG
ncbi:hypothetical protein [Tenacibaculum agarivorans]|uniref:hypothetical protein n=1 Tax=Tenacibaculum agarivorans TaxID=1908389 RepID=UPI001180CC31|nr:hypothetical protein [Tenacibaculum agarivorans]